MGFPIILVGMFLGIVAGGLVAAVLLITGKKKRREGIPFGPFLCLGAIAALLWGKDMLAWYLHLV